MLPLAEAEKGEAWTLIRCLFDTNKDPLAVVGPDGDLVIANAAFTKLLHNVPDKTPGMNIFKIKNTLLNEAGLSAELKAAFQEGGDFQVRSRLGIPESGAWLVTGKVLRQGDDLPARILLHIARQP